MTASSAEMQNLIHAAIELVAAAGLGAARATGIMVVLPVFARAQISGLIRGSFAVAFGLPCLPFVSDGLQALDPETRLIQLTLLGVKEIFVGLLLGTFLGIPLWSLQAAGEFIDNQRGITSPSVPSDPSTNSQASVMGMFLGIMAITIFVASEGLEVVASALYGSFQIWPVYRFQPIRTAQAAMELLGLLDHIMLTTLLVSGPVVSFLLLVDISVMILLRFAPQIKSSQLSPVIKNIAFPFIMTAYTAYLVVGMRLEIKPASGALEWLGKLLK
ncbi:type III secretion system export apparatus subunit SctT [Microvirga lotononidis]|uniref:Type III secretion protein SpaR/YscT/HrcT n=1 Tax=Microvirga lotononidis TaxID=864069 RepID=I4Z458_9HYPH|nr:type III secretion system export apparatus subunit SctT [Microvirga lotononidis]EIM31000.1 type III secretion protein SpaR/YscT/HrcT [Microvirga lotononidis]WQO30178.1 type III secretion system export apparatus subunit SctT [Microvirga lotononidis]